MSSSGSAAVTLRFKIGFCIKRSLFSHLLVAQITCYFLSPPFISVNICDGGIITDDSVRIVSPVGNDGKYPNNLRCNVTIQAPVNKVIFQHGI